MKFEFNWVGKDKLNLSDITNKKLINIKGDGFNENTTQNMYIEGDNLEVLKILKKDYKNKIKCIYIDPPYNTGNKFIYNDKFVYNKNDLLGLGYTKDEVENIIKNNTKKDLSHSCWLNMMYPRLRIARDLLTDDGVIFISIDDNEVHNLRKICDEIFGEDSYVTTICIELSTTMGMKVGAAKKGNIVKNGESILIYSNNKTKNICKNIIYDTRDFDEHFSIYYNKNTNEYCKLKDKISNDVNLNKEIDILKEKKLSKLYQKSNIIKEYILNNSLYIFQDGNFDVSITEEEENSINEFPVHIVKNDREYIVIRNKKGNIRQLMSLDSLIGYANDYYKTYGLTKIRGDFWKDYYLDMVNINKEGNVNFNNGKKPIRLIKDLIYLLNLGTNDIVLDFFSGSATTAHAVMQLNAEDGGNRKYIMVQLPQLCDEKTEAYKNGYKNICEIGKERIRRAGVKIKEENKDNENIQNLDVGFKVFRLED